MHIFILEEENMKEGLRATGDKRRAAASLSHSNSYQASSSASESFFLFLKNIKIKHCSSELVDRIEIKLELFEIVIVMEIETQRDKLAFIPIIQQRWSNLCLELELLSLSLSIAALYWGSTY